MSDNSAWFLLHEGGIEVTAAKNVCHVLDRPGQLIRVTSDGTVGAPVNWRDLPDRDATSFDTAFPFVGNTPQIEPVPSMTRNDIEQASLPDAEPKKCSNPGLPKTQKAEDNDDKPKKKKKRQASNDDNDGPPPPKIVRRTKPKYEKEDDDYGSGGARAMDIIIRGGGGIGGFGGRRPGGGGSDGGNYGKH